MHTYQERPVGIAGKHCATFDGRIVQLSIREAAVIREHS
jgi:hypothetical protein